MGPPGPPKRGLRVRKKATKSNGCERIVVRKQVKVAASNKTDKKSNKREPKWREAEKY